MGQLGHKTLKGTLWSAIERFSVQCVAFAVTIVMANLLTPDEFGLVGMLAVFIAVSQSLIDCGFSQALIRKQNRTAVDTSTVFYFNIVVGVVLYAILYAAGPLIAYFYHEPELDSLVKALGLVMIFNSLAVVQRALLTVRVDFRSQAKASLTAAIVSGAVGITLAWLGYGVWALVYQQLVSSALNTLLLWVVARWRPSVVFSWKSFRELFSFGSRLAAAGIIDTLYKQGWPLVIGRFFSAGTLGYYTNAQRFADLPSSNFTGILQRVTYPVLCTIQNDRERLVNAYSRCIRIAAFCIFPLMGGLAGVAHPLIRVTLGERWTFAAVLLPLLCAQMMWYPIHALNLNLLQVTGRSGVFLKLEIYKKIAGVAILCATVPFGIIAMCCGGIVTSLVALCINTGATGRLLGMGLRRQLKDIFPALLYTVSMWAVITGVTYMISNDVVSLVTGIVVGVIWYLALARLTGSTDLRTLIYIVRHRTLPPGDAQPDKK
ncbi:MAG: lipopolysaccharide biosynthesis protein [Muribaculaceae bacterium]|nr:lipopolysaccharide biosynthesis protein [Muribaculaceae bacterium]